MKGIHARIVRGLLRCYPRTWRERYGEEFAALLADLPPAPGQILDLARGALDAHGQRWQERATAAIDIGPLDANERRFWRRWVVQLLLTGVLLGASYALVPVIVATADAAPFGFGSFATAFEAQVIGGPILIVVALGLGRAQSRALRALLPALKRSWLPVTLLGPLAALALMTIDGGDSRFTAPLTMVDFFYAHLLSQYSDPGIQGLHDYDRLIRSFLTVVIFAGLGATLQACALSGAVKNAAGWIGIAMVAAIPARAIALLLAPLQIGSYQLAPLGVRPDLLLLNTGAMMLQLGAACATYGIVSGLGLIVLRRVRRTRPLTPTLA